MLLKAFDLRRIETLPERDSGGRTLVCRFRRQLAPDPGSPSEPE